MALTTLFRGQAAPSEPPTPEQESLTQRTAWATELAEIVAYNADPILLPLRKTVADAEAILAEARKRLNAAEVEHRFGAITKSNRRREIEIALRQSSPAEISAAVQELERQIVQAKECSRSRTTSHFSEGGGPATVQSNAAKIGEFVTAANAAIRSLEDLRLLVLDGRELSKRIAKILRSVPAFDPAKLEVR